MHRCYAHPDAWEGARVTLPKDESHHVRDVMRLVPGDAVAVFDGCGRAARGVITATSRGAVVLRAENVVVSAAPRVSIALVQALPKGKLMDLIVEKATELGVAEIYPVLTERCATRLDESRAAQRGLRWERIACSASKQCGGDRIPVIHPPRALQEALLVHTFDGLFVGTLAPGLVTLREAIGRLPLSGVSRIAAVIGPEGDFTPEEIAWLMERGGVPVSFGGHTLRVETAALYALSVLTYELLWRP